MDFDEVYDVAADHVVWKVRLLRLIDGSSYESLDSAVVGKDDVCDLGKWIYAEGAKYKATKTYEALVKAHAKFHISAAEAVRRAHDGDKEGARVALVAPDGDFERTSRHIIDALMNLKDEIIEG